jgi:hypothetical protein
MATESPPKAGPYSRPSPSASGTLLARPMSAVRTRPGSAARRVADSTLRLPPIGGGAPGTVDAAGDHGEGKRLAQAPPSSAPTGATTGSASQAGSTQSRQRPSASAGAGAGPAQTSPGERSTGSRDPNSPPLQGDEVRLVPFMTTEGGEASAGKKPLAAPAVPEFLDTSEVRCLTQV